MPIGCAPHHRGDARIRARPREASEANIPNRALRSCKLDIGRERAIRVVIVSPAFSREKRRHRTDANADGARCQPL
jgi:hypothetical protein